MIRAVGIDLGTTYTVVAVMEDGRPRIIPNAEGEHLTPSVVAFTRGGRPLVGRPARRQATANPERTVASIKRQMGTDYKLRIGDRAYSPQELSALILRKAKADAEDSLGEKIDKAVITVPAYFNDRQRQATKEAGLMAGLEVMRIISEPTAAALAYGLDREGIHTVLVWDLGGGTFDVSILEMDDGIFEVRAVSGNTWLGGDDYDQRLADYLAEQHRKAYGADLPADGAFRQRLREIAEKAKIELSSRETTTIFLPFLDKDSVAPRHLKLRLSRKEFQEITRDLLDSMIPPTRQALADAGLEPKDIDRVILVGGATRMPAVWELARQVLGKEPRQDMDPDEVVARGAAVQAGMLLGMLRKVVLLDVLPLSLGVETQGGLFSRVLPRNTPLPASESRIFTTAADNQTSVDVHVLQGERTLAVDNISLGRFQLQGVPPLPRGVPKVEVSFEADVDGIIRVSAADLLTGNEVNVRLISSRGLSQREIERMVAEAESWATEDQERQQRVMAGIQAGNVIAAAELFLEEVNGFATEEQIEETERGLLRVKEALAGDVSQDIVQRSGELRDLLRLVHHAARRASSQEAYRSLS